MKRISTKDEYHELLKELSDSDSGFGGWHEPDQWDLTGRFARLTDHVIRTEGVKLDNAGFWPENPDRPLGSILEMHIIISRLEYDEETEESKPGTDLAAINIANLLEWAH